MAAVVRARGVNLKEQSVRADVQKKETDVIAVVRFDRAA